ncbi:MAG TPA: LytTR family DNA-binding domain-containing protein [Thermoanaerobaculia bacterium]|jgi:two-component system LytT family response regulator|nr:LytTR family DNA-binding domain-containing protein [Thermoanaerobaculia bacterium]
MTAPLRVLVVDDEPLARKDLELMLGAEPGIEVLPGADDGESALSPIAEAKPDVLFLDIRMPGLDGFELLARIEPRNLPLVVFVSAYDEFALKAFAVWALDYLVKPVNPARLRETLDRVRSRRDEHWQSRVAQEVAELRGLFESLASGQPISAQEKRTQEKRGEYPLRLAARETDRIRFVAVESIVWIEADRNYCVLHGREGRFSLRATLSEMESQLDPSRFVRIHRSAIVALDQIRELRPTFRGEYAVALRDGTSLRWSRGYLAALRKFLGTKGD